MDNHAIGRVLEEIADLLEIKNENPFKIRAYRNAADIVANHPHELATLDATGLREIPGIGKDLAARIREIAETGGSEYHRGLMAEFPPSILDMMRLQGVGPKTVAMLHRELGVQTLDDLERAARDGRVRAIKGMGSKKEALILKAIDERKQHAGRHLLATTDAVARAIVAHLQALYPAAQIAPVGSLRRGCETCGDIDILVSGADQSIMSAFIEYPTVERVLGQGETKSSVLMRGGLQADLRLVPAESRGAAEQYFTGSKAHNIALRDRAIGLRSEAERVRTLSQRGQRQDCRGHRAGDLRSAGAGVGRARIARGPRRDRRSRRSRAPPPGRSQRPEGRPAHAHDGDRRRTTISARWCGPRARPGTNTSRSPITASRWPWRTAWTKSAPWRTRPGFARSTARKGSGCWPASNATFASTAPWTWPTTASRPSTSWSRPFIPASTRIASR